MVRQRLEPERTPMVILTCCKNTNLSCTPITRARTLAPTLGSIDKNDLTHSNAANVAGFTCSLQAACDRTVDFTHILRNQQSSLSKQPPTKRLILTGKDRNQPRLSEQ
jgi:hypothetical protein